MEFIDVIDANDEKTSSFAISNKVPNRLQIVGGLRHSSEITFDKKNAQKLVDFLQNNIINK